MDNKKPAVPCGMRVLATAVFLVPLAGIDFF
jgi:hypothetical protein